MVETRSAISAQAFDVASARAMAVGGGAQTSAVAWGAIFGGAAAAIAATLVLLALGTGLGITTVSPWPNAGASATTFGALAAIWVIVVQWISAGLGGYLTGRLRTRWVGMHTHEVFFRDTAHGFMTWSVATIAVGLLFASVVSSAISGGTHAVASVASGAASGAVQAGGQAAAQQGGASLDRTGYFVDTLLRSDNPGAASQGQDSRGEVTRILVTDLGNGQLAPDDRTYLAKLVAARAGISQQDAEQRVDTLFAQMKDAEAKARQAADTARKTAASISIILALSMVLGAFVASAAAAYGGHLREEA
jgi:hypothetical protein